MVKKINTARKKKDPQVSELPAQDQWLLQNPERTEKNHYEKLFEKSKQSIICNLNNDTHIFSRFCYIIQQMESKYPKYTIFQSGEAYQGTNYYHKLWAYHNVLVRRWKDQSPKKFSRSKQSSNTKSTANSERKHQQQRALSKQKEPASPINGFASMIKQTNHHQSERKSQSSKRSKHISLSPNVRRGHNILFQSPDSAKINNTTSQEEGHVFNTVFQLPEEDINSSNQNQDSVTKLSKILPAHAKKPVDAIKLQMDNDREILMENINRIHIYFNHYCRGADEFAQAQKQLLRNEILKLCDPGEQVTNIQ